MKRHCQIFQCEIPVQALRINAVIGDPQRLDQILFHSVRTAHIVYLIASLTQIRQQRDVRRHMTASPAAGQNDRPARIHSLSSSAFCTACAAF